MVLDGNHRVAALKMLLEKYKDNPSKVAMYTSVLAYTLSEDAVAELGAGLALIGSRKCSSNLAACAAACALNVAMIMHCGQISYSGTLHEDVRTSTC